MKSVIALMLIFCVSNAGADTPNYEDHIKPVFRAHCLKCHNADEAEADLDLSKMSAVMKGGSSGPVVKPGQPESSQLYRAMAHLDGVESMPPESPKLAKEKIELIAGWIRGGLIESQGGKSRLRNITTMPAPIKSGRPAPLPTLLPKIKLTPTLRPPIPQAMAVSPGAPLFAVSGQEQILLYQGSDPAPVSFQPTAVNSLARGWAFEDENTNFAGKIGKAARFPADGKPLPVTPAVDFSNFKELTISVWIRPQESENNPNVFGSENGFRLFLERHKQGWRPRIFLRDQDNGISYYGRVGILPLDEWTHLAATWNGSAWNWFIDGQHVAEQTCPESLEQIQQRPDTQQLIGGNSPSRGNGLNPFVGDLDELRIYSKALSHDQIRHLTREASRSKTYVLRGALPFPEGTIHDTKFSRDGSLLMSAGGRGSFFGRVVLFDVETGKRVAEIGDEVDSVLAADISPDHQYVAMGGPSKIIKLYSTKNGKLLHRIKKHTDWITAVAFSPDGKMFATGDRSGGINIWETDRAAIVFTLDEHKVQITDLSWRADSTIVASAAEDGNLILWSMEDGFPLRNIAAHTSDESPRYSRRTGVLSVDFARDSRLLTSGRDGTTRLWSPEGEKLLEVNVKSGLPVNALLLDDSAAAVIGTFDGSLHVFDLASKSRTQTLSTSEESREGGGK